MTGAGPALTAVIRRLCDVEMTVSFGYTVALELLMLALAVISAAGLRRSRGASRARAANRAATGTGVTVVLAAHNEEAGIIQALRSVLASTYPDLEVIVVDDGSTDRTVEILAGTFDLHPVEVPPEAVPSGAGGVHTVWMPASTLALTVISQANGGSKAAATNTGIAYATKPYVVVADGDTLMEPDTIALVMGEVTSAGQAIIGVGATVLPVNDCDVVDGAVVAARAPRRLIPAVQLLEYLRAFLVGRTGMASLGATFLISGAFGLFPTEDLRSVHGYRVGHLGEDLDLALRLRRGRPGQLTQVADAIVWTEVPPTLRSLRGQRIRWQRGLIQALSAHRAAIANPRLGTLGLIGIPYLVVFEFAAPLVEAAGYLTFALSVALGALNMTRAVALLAATFAAGYLNTVLALAIEHRRLRRYFSAADLARLLAVAVVEQLGYRQLTVAWRVWATFRRKGAWGTIPRLGLGTSSAAGVAAT